MLKNFASNSHNATKNNLLTSYLYVGHRLHVFFMLHVCIQIALFNEIAVVFCF
jgi:hypothetical protein